MNKKFWVAYCFDCNQELASGESSFDVEIAAKVHFQKTQHYQTFLGFHVCGMYSKKFFEQEVSMDSFETEKSNNSQKNSNEKSFLTQKFNLKNKVVE